MALERRQSGSDDYYVPKGNAPGRWPNGMNTEERGLVYETHKEAFAGQYSEERGALATSILDQISSPDRDYATEPISASDPRIKQFPVSGTILLAFQQDSNISEPKELMMYCLDYLQNAEENHSEEANSGIDNIDLVEETDVVQVYEEEGRWKIKVTKADGGLRLIGFLFPPDSEPYHRMPIASEDGIEDAPARSSSGEGSTGEAEVADDETAEGLSEPVSLRPRRVMPGRPVTDERERDEPEGDREPDEAESEDEPPPVVLAPGAPPPEVDLLELDELDGEPEPSESEDESEDEPEPAPASLEEFTHQSGMQPMTGLELPDPETPSGSWAYMESAFLNKIEFLDADTGTLAYVGEDGIKYPILALAEHMGFDGSNILMGFPNPLGEEGYLPMYYPIITDAGFRNEIVSYGEQAPQAKYRPRLSKLLRVHEKLFAERPIIYSKGNLFTALGEPYFDYFTPEMPEGEEWRFILDPRHDRLRFFGVITVGDRSFPIQTGFLNIDDLTPERVQSEMQAVRNRLGSFRPSETMVVSMEEGTETKSEKQREKLYAKQTRLFEQLKKDSSAYESLPDMTDLLEEYDEAWILSLEEPDQAVAWKHKAELYRHILTTAYYYGPGGLASFDSVFSDPISFIDEAQVAALRAYYLGGAEGRIDDFNLLTGSNGVEQYKRDYFEWKRAKEEHVPSMGHPGFAALGVDVAGVDFQVDAYRRREMVGSDLPDSFNYMNLVFVEPVGHPYVTVFTYKSEIPGGELQKITIELDILPLGDYALRLYRGERRNLITETFSGKAELDARLQNLIANPDQVLLESAEE